MRYSLQIQQDQVGEAIRARYAMIVPIVQGMLNSTRVDMIEAMGGYEAVTLEQFATIYQEHPGDYGICFEYAVHQSIKDRDASVHPLVSEVLEEFCGIRGGADSILFGPEKSGPSSLLQTAHDSLTEESRILVGRKGRPPNLKRHLELLVRAFRDPKKREDLPQSIRGVWRADLFLGSTGPDQWVATTLKTRKRDLEAGQGLRIGLYPDERSSAEPQLLGDANLVLCPLPYASDFMQLFGASFQIIKQVIARRGARPGRVALVYDDDQEVARWLADRRKYPLLAVLEALEPIKQPGLLADERVVESDKEGIVETAEAEQLELDVVAAAPVPLTVE